MNGFENKVYSFIKENSLIEKGSRVCVALSGGADSMALLHVLKRCERALSITVLAIHINHMIRGAEADRDEAFCKDVCKALGVPLSAKRLDVPAIAEREGISTELAARNARYAAFECADADIIATAHNMSDNAETVLYNLARGTALSGLCGIPPSRPLGAKTVVRPLLCVSGEQIRQYLAEQGVDFVVDSTNLSDDYTRNRIRHTVVPAIKETVNPAFESAVLSMCMALREDERALSHLADGVELSAEALKGCERALATRKIKNALADIDGIGAAHIAAVLDIATGEDPSAEVSLPNGYKAARQYDKIIIEKGKCEVQPFEITLSEGENTYPNGKIEVNVNTKSKDVNNSFTKVLLDCDKITGKLTARSRKVGDKIALEGGTRSVKRLMIDKKVPSKIRDTIPVICDGERVIAVAFCGVDREYKANRNSKTVLTIEIKGNTI